ncbi:pyridoxal phosphate-dependent aminotransferase [Paenibacillus alvei]|uniref:pyridoxal phosphate-dependent aminotransferase n=1 Tax=Paenibacillus TaxID=44249 RepID=UPI000288DB5F|nr:pyridoxal phosphate-dependent aminotransferase [Paenibacillus alvei]EJW18208.1 transaminase MtnE [Paenibacillus alvei DSM 29]MCY9543759.1 pyridoxal phosphate-dependent aminotransferase [Paenibacillus alvei]MCY9703696.1 pyridoxal phosphate-dependent aminotransferase [Paenibacillus alvei]MCY9732575.1 pyridoxal phosphate-dependent aminotransferase [Paenibacillus alvei]MCY9754366.1 pyridoxal phosphate-dependent aminotransferase [Paenibacillus alvei]
MLDESYRSISIRPAERMDRLPKQFFAQLVERTNARIAAGHDVINLGQGNPDLPTAPHIVTALQEAAADPINHKYPPFSGHRYLKEAIAQRYKEDYDVVLDPDTEVAVLFGGKTGLVEISQILLNSGDVCLVPDPGYPDYWSGAALAGAEMVMMPLLETNQFLPDYGRITKQQLERAKLMFLNYPNNPTSAVASHTFYKETVQFAAQHNIVVASDFAYGAIGFDGKRPVSFLQTPGAKDVGVEFYTMSKTYNMAGWRVAFAVGNKELIRLINLMQDHMYVSLFGAVQAAAAAALTQSQQSVRALCAIYEKRRNVFFKELHRIGWEAVPSAGSFFAWLPVPKSYTSAEFADFLLEHANVVTAPGIGFGQHGEGYVRVGLLATEERLCEAAERIGRLSLF